MWTLNISRPHTDCFSADVECNVRMLTVFLWTFNKAICVGFWGAYPPRRMELANSRVEFSGRKQCQHFSGKNWVPEWFKSKKNHV